MIRIKIDVLPLLKENGYSTYKLRKDGILSESTIQKLREHKIVSFETLDWLCGTLNLQPGDIIEYVKCDSNDKYDYLPITTDKKETAIEKQEECNKFQQQIAAPYRSNTDNKDDGVVPW